MSPDSIREFLRSLKRLASQSPACRSKIAVGNSPGSGSAGSPNPVGSNPESTNAHQFQALPHSDEFIGIKKFFLWRQPRSFESSFHTFAWPIPSTIPPLNDDLLQVGLTTIHNQWHAVIFFLILVFHLLGQYPLLGPRKFDVEKYTLNPAWQQGLLPHLFISSGLITPIHRSQSYLISPVWLVFALSNSARRIEPIFSALYATYPKRIALHTKEIG